MKINLEAEDGRVVISFVPDRPHPVAARIAAELDAHLRDNRFAIKGFEETLARAATVLKSNSGLSVRLPIEEARTLLHGLNTTIEFAAEHLEEEIERAR